MDSLFVPAVLGSSKSTGAIVVCLGVPGRVVESHREHGLLMGKVDFGGVSKLVCLEHVPEVQEGDHVIVHVGFALSVIDEAEAQEVFALLKEMGELEELQNPPNAPHHNPRSSSDQ